MTFKTYSAAINETYEITIPGDEAMSLDSVRTGEDTYHVLQDFKGYAFRLVEFDPVHKTFLWEYDGTTILVRLRNQVETLVHSMGLEDVEHDKVNAVSAPMPGLVLDIKVKPGDQVRQHDTLMILEAMKMENVIAAPNAGTVTEIFVQAGDKVEKAQDLLKLD